MCTIIKDAFDIILEYNLFTPCYIFGKGRLMEFPAIAL